MDCSDNHTRNDRRRDWLIAAVLALVAGAVFIPSVPGEFVYDDTWQIVENDLIKSPRHLWTALTTDVWSFRRPGADGGSLYYRPTFIAWLIVNYQMFGLNPVGWHVTNIFLHALVVAAVFGFLRRLQLNRGLATAIALLFAVHPVHVESVAWISGSPDLLMSVAALPAMTLVLPGTRQLMPRHMIAACGLYAIAMGSKEVAVVMPVVVFIAVYVTMSSVNRRDRIMVAVRRAIPFVAIAAAYMIARVMVLEGAGLSRSSQLGADNIVLTAPSIAVFYLRQIFFPLWIGASYPLRAVGLENLGAWNFLIPLAIVAVVVTLLPPIVRRNPVCIIGLALASFLLAPAFNISAFFIEHLVHDRYLYLPLLGVLMIVVPMFAKTSERLIRISSQANARLQLIGSLIVSIPLVYQTVRATTPWRNELSLWQHAVTIDPHSAFNHSQLGIELHKAGRVNEALESFDRSLAIAPFQNAYYGRAHALIALGRFQDAENDLHQVLEEYGPDMRAYERLAIVYEQQGKLALAAAMLREARISLPVQRCAVTDMLAVVLYKAGRRAEALGELESVRDDVKNELGSRARMVLFHLGSLYAEMNRPAEARSTLQDFLRVSEGYAGDEIVAARQSAQQLLNSRGKP